MKDKTIKQSRRNFLQATSLAGISIPFLGLGNTALAAEDIEQTNLAEKQVYQILKSGDRIEIIAGDFKRIISLSDQQIKSKGLQIDGQEMLSPLGKEFKVSFYKASPNVKPVGLKLQKDETLIWADGTAVNKSADNQPVKWNDELQLDGDKMASHFRILRAVISQPRPGTHRLSVKARSLAKSELDSVTIEIFYEIYEGYPSIRKWINITNNGSEWLKIGQLSIDDIDLASGFRVAIPLTPEEQGAESSIISFGNKQETMGIIAASEVPSAPRKIFKNGAMGYNDDYFEWVIGPSENFTSEPVIHFAYAGEVINTSSGISKPLDRANEGLFKSFLQKCVGLRGTNTPIPAPIWCSYSNFLTDLTDYNMREQADIAARIGFDTFQLDEGWAKAPSPGGSEPDTDRFPDFEATCKYINSKGLQLGLWISCFRSRDSKDFKAMPDARNLPIIINTKRGEGMSFSSDWVNYFANDILYMRDRYNMIYVKEDLTNIAKGDIADSHYSRTKKESYLRGLRGLFEVNRIVAEQAPDVWTQITHEIYWRTPGPPADIAALKYGCAFHTTPNTYLGPGTASKRIHQNMDFDPRKLRADLIKSCAQARNRYFDHRGVPAYSVEFYAAHAVNVKGSLTPSVQDRQICSWLMGAPTVFAGDLSSLTEAHILHYRNRFDLLKRLQSTYNIYRFFQYSGVPLPTDVDWHWWGKLNEDGIGVTVVLRGSDGKEERQINIPWAHPDKKYQVTLLFANKKIGVISGRDLIEGKLKLQLPIYGQEIVELAKA